jgi:HlyD family secretion protein
MFVPSAGRLKSGQGETFHERMFRMTRRRIVIFAVIAVAVIGGGGYYYYRVLQSRLPPGIAFGNGRIEGDEIAISTKYAGRIAEIDFKEGDLVQKGQVLARMDTSELAASERAAAALAEQRQKDVEASRATIQVRQAELDLANSELARGKILVAKDAISRQRVEQLTAAQISATERLAAAKSATAAAEAAVVAAKSEQERLQHMIDDSTLIAPKLGRMLFRPANIGETLPAGGQVGTLVDLSDIYMTFFLPSTQAARLALGAPGRIVVDAMPGRPIPGYVSFVSPRGQFTPKQVETQTERERMMFRVKLSVPEPLVMKYINQIKVGVTGVAYVKLDSNVKWPHWLESDLTAEAATE